MEKINFTIAIPTFNSIKNLKKSINSVLNQNIPSGVNLTIAISNIASHDGTYDYLETLKKKKKFNIHNSRFDKTDSQSLNLYCLGNMIPNNSNWVWLLGDDDQLTHENVIANVCDKIINNFDEDLNLVVACGANRCRQTNEIFKDEIFQLCNKFGYHEMLGWMSSLIMKSDIMKKVLQDTYMHPEMYKITDNNVHVHEKYPYSAYPHSFAILRHISKKKGIFIDSPLVERQSKEQTEESLSQWAVDSIGQRYLFVADDLIRLLKYNIIEESSCSKVFFRYQTYHLWDKWALWMLNYLIIHSKNQNITESLLISLQKWNNSNWKRISSLLSLLDNKNDKKVFSTFIQIGINFSTIFLKSGLSEPIREHYIKNFEQVVNQMNYNFEINDF
jgi:abequosyltransferase